MWSSPKLSLISELLELLDCGDAPRVWDQLVQEQSQVQAQYPSSGIGSRESHLPVLAVLAHSCPWCLVLGRELFGLGQLCSSPSCNHLCRLEGAPWGGKQLFLHKEPACCPGLSPPSALEKSFFPGTRVSGPAQSNYLCPLC